MKLIVSLTLCIGLTGLAHAQNWPSFRGPQAAGVNDAQPLPTTGNAKTSQNIKWKTALPGLGYSSPVVWENRIFLTAAITSNPQPSLNLTQHGGAMSRDLSKHSWRVYGLDKRSGKLLWERTAYEGVPTALSAYIAISPSVYWNDSAVIESVRQSVAAGKDRPAGHLSLALSEAESPTIVTSTQSLRATLQANATESLRWTFAEFAREHHLTVPYPALHAALRWLFGSWVLPLDPTATRIAAEGKLDAFEAHFASLSKRYNYNVQPTEMVISMIGDRLCRSRDFDEAIALFRRRAQLYPESPEAHDEHEAAGQRALAIESYERASALAVSQKHPSLAALRGRLEQIRR